MIIGSGQVNVNLREKMVINKIQCIFYSNKSYLVLAHPGTLHLVIRLMLEPCNGWRCAVVGNLGCLLTVEAQSHLLLLHERLQVGDKNMDLSCGAQGDL